MFDHKHYVPILKTKAGERWAIDHTSAARKTDLTPLFEIHRHADKGATDHAAEICENLESVWGTSHNLFLDTCWLHTASGDPPVIESVFASARSAGLLAIPVVRISYDAATLDVIADIVSTDNRGWLLRISPNDIANHAAIDAVATHVGVPRSEVDLLLDYKNIAMHLTAHVPALPTITDWRTFSSASAAFPRSLSSYSQGTWHQVTRDDWASWQMGLASGLSRNPSYSDYTIRDSGPAAEFGDPSVNLRYTKDTFWLVRTARKFRQGFAGDMHAICADLIARPEYDGPNFSDGDAAINATANPASTSGAPQQWLQWGMNHHIAYTVDQLQALP